MSTETTTSLFSDPSNIAALRRFVMELQFVQKGSVSPEGLVQSLEGIINLMISNADKFNEFASVNIEWIGRSFIDEISSYSGVPAENKQAAIRSIFTSSYRFLCEFDFTQPYDSVFEVRKVTNFVHENLEAFEGNDRQQLVYASYTMPAQVVKKLITHPSVTDFRKFSETIEKSRTLKEKWDIDFENHEKLLKGLDENIQKTTSEYNFVGLVNGFKKLKETKEIERKIAFWSLFVMGLMMFVVPIAQLIFVIDRLVEIENLKPVLVYSIPAIVTIEIIMLYLFRVVLGQFRSVKAQLLQVDLRISLCQFIESYAEYVSKLRKTDSSALEKFEALIFSGLAIDEVGLPSTFDGVDQIASLIRSVRGGSKT